MLDDRRLLRRRLARDRPAAVRRGRARGERRARVLHPRRRPVRAAALRRRHALQGRLAPPSTARRPAHGSGVFDARVLHEQDAPPERPALRREASTGVCPICFEPHHCTSTPCGHAFCAACICRSSARRRHLPTGAPECAMSYLLRTRYHRRPSRCRRRRRKRRARTRIVTKARIPFILHDTRSSSAGRLCSRAPRAACARQPSSRRRLERAVGAPERDAAHDRGLASRHGTTGSRSPVAAL